MSGRNRQLLPIALFILALAPGCEENAPDDLIMVEETTEAIVFVKTKGEETLNRSNAEGNLYKLSPISPDGNVTPITNFVGASVSDPCVSFDGERILFSMRPPEGGARNIYEIDADGTNMRQVTAGGGNDFDPLYLPDGNIMFTSSRAGEMDEYNHSPAEHLFIGGLDGSGIHRISFNQSDDFDPVLMPSGLIVYTRWEHFGTFNRFPLFFTTQEGSQTFHKYGPHNRNFFHAQPTPDGRMIAIESRSVNEDAGPIAILKTEQGPADPAGSDTDLHWDVLTAEVNGNGAPWTFGAFKYPFALGGSRYIASYTLPAASESEVDYGLYTFTLSQRGAGTTEDPASISIDDLTFLYNDPEWNEYDAQLLAPREKPPVTPSVIDESKDFGIFMGHNVFKRGENDGQERPEKGVDTINEMAIIAAIPTMAGEPNDFSANTFEKRAIIGFAPVYEDGSFRIKVPADVPLTFATLDEHRRGFVVKRTWIYVRPGETVDQCTGCHTDRGFVDIEAADTTPIAATREPTDLNISPENYTYINYRDQISPIVERNCAGCHLETYVERDSLEITLNDSLGVLDSLWLTVTDTLAPPGSLDLTSVLDTIGQRMQVFPRAYINLSGGNTMGGNSVTVPPFPRRSLLIDYVLGLGVAADKGAHPGDHVLTDQEKELFNLWVTLGAQYR